MIAKAAPRRGELPWSMAAERALLGSLLLNADEGWDEGVHEVVRAPDFYFEPHRAIYAAMRALAVKHVEVGAVTVAHELAEQGVIGEVDRLLEPDRTEPYLVGLWADTFASTGCIAFARMVREYADRRKRIEQGAAIVREAYQGKAAGGRGGVAL